jgi:hypothetical protein
MFQPDIPPPSKYRRTAPPKEENTACPVWIKRIMQLVFILIGTAAIVGMVLYGPAGKRIVCDKSKQVAGSLTSFGSCIGESN